MDLAAHAEDFRFGESSEHNLIVYLENLKHSNRLPIQQVDDWTITGNGHVHSDRCGNIASAYHKLGAPGRDKKYWRILTYYCHTQDCPECNNTWSNRAGKEAALSLFMKSVILRTPIHHDIMSWSLEHYENAKASALEYNREHKEEDDFRPRDVWDYLEARLRIVLHYLHEGSHPLGYSYVHHPYSIACLKCGERLDKENNDKVPYQCPSCGSILSYGWRFHPHTHIISNSFTRIKTVRAQECLDGDVYKNIRNLGTKWELGDPKTRRLAALDKIFKLVRYELSHALFRPGRHAINHCGAFANVHWTTSKTSITQDYNDEEDNTPYAKVFLKRMDGDQKCKKILMHSMNKPVYTLADRKMIYLQKVTTLVSIVPKKAHFRVQHPVRKLKFKNPNTGENEFEVIFPPRFKDKYVQLQDFKLNNNLRTGIIPLDAFFKVLPKRYYFVKGKPIELTRTGRLKQKCLKAMDITS